MAKPNVNTFAPAHEGKARKYTMPVLQRKSKVIVIGAGNFGGWSALYLLRKGFKVTLIDAWGAGNSRSSSGDETRVIRSTYGGNETYFDLNVRAIELWKENQKQFDRKIFFNQGVLWLCYEEQTPLVDESIPFAKKHKMDYEYLSPSDIKKRYPLIRNDDLHHAYLDPFGGYLKARESCQCALELFIKEGGEYIQSFVKPDSIESGKMKSILLEDGTSLTADVYLFACGPWMGQVFPDVLKSTITCTRQEAYYFGVPHRYASAFDSLPVWVDVDGKDFYYGIPGNANRGFKIGVDIRGASFDPSTGDRVPDPAVLLKARNFITHRFPELKGAPLVESRVCPYENSTDGNFIFDVHPEASNTLFLGGGSGHGFKHGPALGELVANVLSGEVDPPSIFQNTIR